MRQYGGQICKPIDREIHSEVGRVVPKERSKCSEKAILQMPLRCQCSWRTKAKRLLPLDHSRCAQHIPLRAPLPDDLDSNRKSCLGKTDRYRHRGLAGHIPGKRIGTPSPIAIGKSLRDIAFGGPRPRGDAWEYTK